MAIALGLLWAFWAQPLPGVLDNFSRILGGAAGPCALFAIGASLGVAFFAPDGERLAATQIAGGRPRLARYLVMVSVDTTLVMAAVLAMVAKWRA